MSKEAMKLAQKWQQTDWNTESPMSADFAVSEAHDVINALIDALREALAEQPAQRKPLTDEEIKQFASKHLDVGDGSCATHFVTGDVAFARAIEAAHNIKENT